MKPEKTLYRLMEPTDQPIIERIWTDHRKIFGEPKELEFPTVLADREGTILGAVTTDTSMGPIYMRVVVVPPCSFITFMRLFEAYENILKLTGVDGYFGAFKKKGHEKVIRIIESLGIKPYRTIRGMVYYRRNLNA